MFTAFIIIDIIIGIGSFILYCRARMHENTAREKQYLRVHSIALAVLLVAGVIYMFFMVETAT